MNRLKNKWSLITGATSGIGKETAMLFAEKKCNVIITGRRNARLADLKELLTAKYGIRVLTGAFDVRDFEAVQEFIESLEQDIDILVNNAGLAVGKDPVDQVSKDDWDTMIDTNIKGLLSVSRLIAPGMKTRRKGHIINVGSVAGHEPYAGGSVYSATKHAVKAITEATKKDLHGTQVRVSMVSPGLVETEFSNIRFRGDKQKADNVYKGIEPLTGRDIAEIIMFIANRPAHVNILDTLVYPTAQSSATMVYRDE